MRRSALVGVLVVASLGLSTGVAASPQPTPVCGICGGALESAVDDSGPLDGLAVDRSVVTVQVHEDGSATWRVRNRLGNDSAVAYLRDHPEALDRLTASALESGAVEGPFRNVSATLDGSTMAVRFEDRTAARRTPGGVLVVDYLHDRGEDAWPVVTADRFTVVGPDGTTVTNSPPGARIDGRNATWTGNASVPFYEAPSVESAYVAFASDGIGAGLWTALGLALATAPIVAGVLWNVHLPPVLVLAVGLVAVTAGGRRLLSWSSALAPRNVAGGVAAIGGIAVVASALGTVVPPLEAPRLVFEAGALYLAVGAVAARQGPDARVRDASIAGLLVLVAIVLGAAVALPGAHVTGSEALRRGVQDGVRLLPLLVMVPLGSIATGGDAPDAILGLVAVLLAFFAAELSVVWPTREPFGPAVILFVAGAVALVVVGFPLLLLGGVIGCGRASEGRPEPDDADPVPAETSD